MSDFEPEYDREFDPFDNPDEPEFDLLAFEPEAIARANEFAKQVKRLSRFAIEDSHEWTDEKGAEYWLDDGTRIAAKYEIYYGDKKKFFANLRVIRKPVEGPGLDGQLRRVTLTRYLTYHSFIDEPDPETVAQLDKLFPVNPELEEGLQNFVEGVQAHRMEDRMDPDWHPDELIRARSSTLVEVKLPSSVNFRTEEYSRLRKEDEKLAHVAARRRAGEHPAEELLYGVPEHKALIAMLAGIDPRKTKPEPLDDDFDATWKEPEATLRSWMPKS